MRITWAVASILAALTAVIPSAADGPSKFGDVSQRRVLAEASRGNNWLVTGAGFEQQHFSPLKQITPQNIGTLGLAWSTDIESAMGLATEPKAYDLDQSKRNAAK